MFRTCRETWKRAPSLTLVPKGKASASDEPHGPVGSDGSEPHTMAKIFVIRPRLGPSWDIEQRFDVLIDGKPIAPIGLGETIVIDLPPGPHLVGARFATAGSPPILVETA